jgi:hypothetical protein
MMHTPAPWKLATGQSTRVLLINGARGHAVGEYVDTRNPADAQLIAAAPDLLAALIGAEQCITKAMPHLPPDSLAVFCGEWLADIREAIQKAAP